MRTRDAIVEATYALISVGDDDITAEKIARRAKVGLRTVFRQFEAMDELFARVASRLARDLLPLSPPAPPSGDLEADVGALVRRRSAANERIVPFLRAARRLRGEVPAWTVQAEQIRRALRSAQERALAPHLPPRPATTIEAIELLLSPEAWERLRVGQRLSVPRATDVVEVSCLALLSG